jgi:hypothetical protein
VIWCSAHWCAGGEADVARIQESRTLHGRLLSVVAAVVLAFVVLATAIYLAAGSNIVVSAAAVECTGAMEQMNSIH